MKLIKAIVKPFKLDEVKKPSLKLVSLDLPYQKSRALVAKKAILRSTVAVNTRSISCLRQ